MRQLLSELREIDDGGVDEIDVLLRRKKTKQQLVRRRLYAQHGAEASRLKAAQGS